MGVLEKALRALGTPEYIVYGACIVFGLCLWFLNGRAARTATRVSADAAKVNADAARIAAEARDDEAELKREVRLDQVAKDLIADLRLDLIRVRGERDIEAAGRHDAERGREEERVRAHDLANEVQRSWTVMRIKGIDPHEGMDIEAIADLRRKLQPLIVQRRPAS